MFSFPCSSVNHCIVESMYQFLCILFDEHDFENSLAERIKQQLEAGEFINATSTWIQLEYVINISSNFVVLTYIFIHNNFKLLNEISL